MLIVYCVHHSARPGSSGIRSCELFSKLATMLLTKALLSPVNESRSFSRLADRCLSLAWRRSSLKTEDVNVDHHRANGCGCRSSALLLVTVVASTGFGGSEDDDPNTVSLLSVGFRVAVVASEATGWTSESSIGPLWQIPITCVQITIFLLWIQNGSTHSKPRKPIKAEMWETMHPKQCWTNAIFEQLARKRRSFDLFRRCKTIFTWKSGSATLFNKRFTHAKDEDRGCEHLGEHCLGDKPNADLLRIFWWFVRRTNQTTNDPGLYVNCVFLYTQGARCETRVTTVFNDSRRLEAREKRVVGHQHVDDIKLCNFADLALLHDTSKSVGAHTRVQAIQGTHLYT